MVLPAVSTLRVRFPKTVPAILTHKTEGRNDERSFREKWEECQERTLEAHLGSVIGNSTGLSHAPRRDTR